MTKQKTVGLLIETSNAYARGLLSGIASYIHEHDLWSIYLIEQERGAAPPSWLKDWDGDGLIARIENDAIANVIKQLKMPIVDVSAARKMPKVPWVETNDTAIAQLAFEHFRERGFEHFAYCGESDFQWSMQRQLAFEQLVTEAGFTCSLFTANTRPTRMLSLKRERLRMAKWLLSLPRPTGILACYDIKAQQVLDVCREYEIKVPMEIALLGVDNDELLCDLCTPPLSSVAPAAHQTGREAAAMLDVLMKGGVVKPLSKLLEPLGVVTRQSTDVLAIEDPEIASAVRYIRDHCCEGINVNDVLKTIPLSRRVFENRFLAIVGRTPHQEIIRRRIERVRRLLVETNLPLSQIADRCGFMNHEYMSVAFRRAMDIPPATYRRNIRKHYTNSPSAESP
ncbi:Xylose operon regulatory protein [Rubripirellula amarantea]|uniref:Xylose operon regulatory protein n=1 Tax=Rubripirellula amarantea TaxID=2527999 RepID=A0A5C5WFK7_9BACT|nr:DNA-binding transcriptional regulator [Rubripirellula amarantea]TWT49317.1 Xylose operon regulatory protein [Rubripirellula amarantea]